MKVNVLKKTRNELKIEIEGEGHTFCNALQQVLLEDRSVEFAGYDLTHPLVGQSVIYIRVKGTRKPERVLINAAKKLGVKTAEAREAFEKAWKRREKA